jgi:hypothetical protein
VLRNSAIPRGGARHERILKAVLIVVALMASLSNVYFIRQLFQLITDLRRGHILAIDRWWYSRRTWSDRGRGDWVVLTRKRADVRDGNEARFELDAIPFAFHHAVLQSLKLRC